MVVDPHTDKPLDVGTGTVCASFAADGSWLSVGRPHPRVGFVEINGMPPFDETRRGDPVATRRYRATMIDPGSAFLRVRALGRPPPRLAVSTDDPRTVSWRRSEAEGPVAVASGGPGEHCVTQQWRFDDGRDGTVVEFAGRLDRPALAEITEINPPTPTGAVTHLAADGDRLIVRSPALPAVATIQASGEAWELTATGARLRLPATRRSLELTVTLESAIDPESGATQHDLPAGWPPAPTDGGDGRSGVAGIERLLARALTYVRTCTALAVGPAERAFLTDHRLLPLSWTRDAYYQALLLLATGDAADQGRVADHLRWLWRRCLRADGRWMRSHHANGKPKDLAFQADQQLYPLVELADFWRASGGLPDGVDWPRLVPPAWQAALAAVDPATGLIASEENAADDHADLPYIAASQVLLWYAALRLAEPLLARQIGLSSTELTAVADRIRTATARHIVVRGRWAYAVDGQGRSVDYHDANDLPTALAPIWGFCPSDDPTWRATIDFAFSRANPGYVTARMGGLGSAHTPGAWTLGDIQGWLVARTIGDDAAAGASLERLVQAAFGDGMLPEAYQSSAESVTRIRHWFAWPGAALGAFWLLDRRGALELLAAQLR